MHLAMGLGLLALGVVPIGGLLTVAGAARMARGWRARPEQRAEESRKLREAWGLEAL